MPAAPARDGLDQGGVEALIERARDDFIAQFKSFIVARQHSCTHGASELKVQFDAPSPSFERLYCVDFISDDEDYRVYAFDADTFEIADVVSLPFGAATLSISSLRWDGTRVRHDLASTSLEAIARWHRHWFDPDDARPAPDAPLSGVIHALLIEPGRVLVDFGTAPSAAFWELLRLLEGAGAKNIGVCGTLQGKATEESSPAPTNLGAPH
jgi:hypothetical protein